MATKQEITAAIQDSNQQVNDTISVLTEAQAQTRVGEGGDGWTIKEVLSHMAGRKPAYERILTVAQGGTLEYGTNLDPDAYNATLVNARQDQSLAAILAEFLTVHAWVITQVQVLPEASLALPITLRQRQMELGDLLQLAAAGHSIAHLKEVRQALGQP